MFIITSLLTMLFVLWTVARIWKSSPPLAAVSFLVFPVAIVPLIQNWGDEETDIKVPFFLALASWAYTVYSLLSYVRAEPEEQEVFLAIARMFA
jgi:4-amino-4-deoxy-L-arabinose transferase-like glycosyltransferase